MELNILLLYFVLINVITFLFFGLDKSKAKRNKTRIPENVLFLLTALGGFLGAIFGMLFFKHKTAKKAFIIKMALIICVQIAVAYSVFLIIEKAFINSSF